MTESGVAAQQKESADFFPFVYASPVRPDTYEQEKQPSAISFPHAFLILWHLKLLC